MSPRNDDYMRSGDTNTTCQKLGLALWNKDEKTVLGRTAKGWGLLLLFYSLFYLVLAAMFTICMFTVFKILPQDRPMYTLAESLIGTNPGMGFRPQFVDEGSLIWYDAQNDTQVAKYVGQLNEWLQEYTNLSYPGAEHRMPCDFSASREQLTQACAVDAGDFGPCTADNQFGYKSKQPCIFLKLNRIYGWVPEYYTSPQEEPNMPADLKEYIDKLSTDKREQIWVSCKGESPGDNEGLNFNPALNSSIKYYPTRGVPWYYFPYRNQPGYVNPIVAVQFTNLEPGRIINIRCRAWAKNIIFSQSLKVLSGSTHIEIMIDDSTTK